MDAKMDGLRVRIRVKTIIGFGKPSLAEKWPNLAKSPESCNSGDISRCIDLFSTLLPSEKQKYMGVDRLHAF